MARALSRSRRARSPPALRWSRQAATTVSSRGERTRARMRLERILGARARAQLGGGAAQLGAGGARRGACGLDDRTAQRVPAGEGVGHRERQARHLEVDRPPVALAARPQDPARPPTARPPPATSAGERTGQQGPDAEGRRRAGQQQPPPLGRARDRGPRARA